MRRSGRAALAKHGVDRAAGGRRAEGDRLGTARRPSDRPERPTLPAVPPIDAVIDSPGVRLAYRLPIDAASGWVSFTMAAVCLAWNTLVAVFVVQVVRPHLAGQPNWLLTWLMVPFVLAGGWTLVRAGAADSADDAHRHDAARGLAASASIRAADTKASSRKPAGCTSAGFKCSSCARSRPFINKAPTRGERPRRVYRATLFSQRKFDITPRQRVRNAAFTFDVPGDGDALVRGGAQCGDLDARRPRPMARWGEFERRFPIYVYPRT